MTVERIVESLLEAASGSELYHVTQIDNAVSIVKSKRLKGDDFISFGSRPKLTMGGVMLVFDASKIKPHVERVEYTGEWMSANPDKAEYIGIPIKIFSPDSAVLSADLRYYAEECEYISKKPGSMPLNGLKRIVVKKHPNKRDLKALQDASPVPVVFLRGFGRGSRKPCPW